MALLLCIFLGWVGAHRFYAKYIWTSIAMALTVGGFGLWVFYDIIMIVIGKFRDADGACMKDWNLKFTSPANIAGVVL